MQKELNETLNRLNNQVQRKQKDKILPSGCSADEAYSLYRTWGATWCLQKVEQSVVEELMNGIAEGADLIHDFGVPPEFMARADEVLVELGVEQDDITMRNVWYIFQQMLPYVE